MMDSVYISLGFKSEEGDPIQVKKEPINELSGSGVGDADLQVGDKVSHMMDSARTRLEVKSDEGDKI